MNIRQRSAPEGWMVSLVGMSDMVPTFVDHATQKVAVFEGSAKIRAQLIHWMESKEGTRQLRTPRSRVDAETAADIDGMSHTSEEDTSSHGEGVGGVPIMEVPSHNVKGKNAESSPEEAIEDAAAHGPNLVPSSAGGGECSTYAGHSRGEDHGATTIHEKDMTNVHVVDTSSVHGTEQTDSALGTTELGSLVGKNQEWIPTISALIYVAEGNYSTDRLDRMWVQQQPEGDIDALDRDRWGMFNGTYFRRIELSELLERQSDEAALKKHSSSTGMHDAVSSLLMMASASSTVEVHAGDDLERVLETPPE